MAQHPEIARVRAENEELQRQLTEAQETLRAIQSGEVDALVVKAPDGHQLYTLESAYEPYRVFVEHMQQGAASLAPDGVVLYANARLAEILGVPHDRLVGASIFSVLEPNRRAPLESLLAGPAGTPRDAEAVLDRPGRGHAHVLFHVVVLPDGTRCVVVTDITERVRQGEILASREWLKVTLTSIGDAVLACDSEGRVTFVNPVAEALTGWPEADAIGQRIQDIFRVVDEDTHEPGEDYAGRALREGVVITLANHTALVTRDGTLVAIEDSAAPIRDADGMIVGAVIVFHDATARRRAQQDLRDSEARLAEANRAKDDFLATLSHELRTPMQAIYGWAQIFRRTNLDAETRDRGVQAILRNSEAQMQLITDILDVSRIVSGRLRLAVGPVDLVGVVYAALDAVRPAADAKGIAVTTSIAATSTVVPGDADRLQQVVWNLLSNAIKFTPHGGKIDVSLQRTASQFAIGVTDNGIGVTPDLLPHVFERFVQGDSSPRRAQGGLGLGLSIVRHLTELHGGTVEAESEGAGKGATFTVHLPIRAVAQGRTDEAPSAAPAQPVSAPGPALVGVRVLVVDDEQDARDLLVTVLGSYGAHVSVAASAADALARLRGDRFNVLVADIGMPEQDGYELIAGIRHLPDAGGGIPAVALTAYGRPDDAERALAAGFHAHLAKPVSEEVLVMTVARLAGRSGTAS